MQETAKRMVSPILARKYHLPHQRHALGLVEMAQQDIPQRQ